MVWKKFIIPIAIFLLIIDFLISYYIIAGKDSNILITKTINSFLSVKTNNPPKIMIVSPSINQNTNSKNGENKIIAKIGKENIYQSDYDFYLNSFFNNRKTTNQLSLKKTVLDKIAFDSIILQELVVKPPLSTSDIFNNPDKNITERNIQIEKTKEKINTDIVGKISFEAIRIYFKNTPGPTPRMNQEKAKALALKHMQSIHLKLKNNEINLAGAGKEIEKITELAQIDSVYISNAYIKVTDKLLSEKIFEHFTTDEIIKKMPVGQLSEIITVKEGSPQTPHEACFMVFKILSRPSINSTTLTDWYNKVKSKYEIITY